MAAVQLGIDNLLVTQPTWLKTARIGLLANQASVDGSLRHSRDRLLAAGAKITALFAPQHGYFGEQQANMIESDDFVDLRLHLPVFSLYGRSGSLTAWQRLSSLLFLCSIELCWSICTCCIEELQTASLRRIGENGVPIGQIR